jgi:hypothetical protein
VTKSPDSSSDEVDPSPSEPGDDQTHDPDEELIDEIGEESFPASDSPSSWSGPPSASP